MKQYILITLIVLLVTKIYLDSDSYNLKCIISKIDKNEYCVRETKNLHLVADLFAKISLKSKSLIDHIKKKKKKTEGEIRLIEKYNPKSIVEILPTSKYTAYSENKGEKIALCATKKKNGDDLIDENTLMFVTLHELAHIMTVSIGHTKEYWNNFKILLNESVEIDIYNPIDYSKEPIEYCGEEITDSPYYS